MTGRSPASSPRLPSPPPIAEDQVGGPTSPGISLYEEHGKIPGAGPFDTGASRRIRPGTTAGDMAEGPPLVELHDIDSAFQLTEHLKALHYAQTHPSDSESTHPITAEIASQLSRPPANTSKDIWLYELGRFLIQKTNAIIVALFADNPPCSAQTCPEMRASEWQYLCAVHDPPKSCSAIDYCCHTLDWAATTLTSSKMFPSRLGLGSGNLGGGNDKVLQQQMKEITNIFRRVYRIYAHAWFQHREMFWRVESKTGLYVFFKTVCDEYGMIQPENYTIPPEAEGLEPAEPTRPSQQDIFHGLSVLKRDQGPEHELDAMATLPEAAGNVVIAPGDTSKRHRHTMSDRAGSISTVIHEEAEDEEEPAHTNPTDRLPESPATGKQATRPLDHIEPSPPSVEPKQGETAQEMTRNGQHAAEEADEPVMGVKRSDTIKPPTKDEPADAVEPEEDVTEFKIDATEVKSEPVTTGSEEGAAAVKAEPAEAKLPAATEHEEAPTTAAE